MNTHGNVNKLKIKKDTHLPSATEYSCILDHPTAVCTSLLQAIKNTQIITSSIITLPSVRLGHEMADYKK